MSVTEDATGVPMWKDQMSTFDRVRSVAGTVSQPRPASFIGDEAHVAENTARDHLERLVNMNVLLKSDDEGTAMYQPDPLHTRAQTLRELLNEYDHDGLIQLKSDLQEKIEMWQDEYDVTSPEKLRNRAADTDEVAETGNIRKVASNWELIAYRLHIVEEAIENYDTYNRKNLR